MAKDYFQDIVPPEEDSSSSVRGGRAQRSDGRRVSVPIHKIEAEEEETQDDTLTYDSEPEPAQARGIRNIGVPQRIARRSFTGDQRSNSSGFGTRTRRAVGRTWIWILAGILLLGILGLGLFIFRPTTVTVTPRSHLITFDTTSQFVAYPTTNAATGTLTYTVESTDLEDSQVVSSQGSQHVEKKASGTITIYNDLPNVQQFVKDTRFKTPAGLIFKAASAVTIPAKKGSMPGHVDVTVIAEKIGEQYNIGPISKFTVPGLETNAAMYSKIYAESKSQMTGGFSGDQAGVSPAAQQAAIADIRNRLESKAHEWAASLATAERAVYPDLMRIAYTDLPQTKENDTSVRIHVSAHVQIPVFSAPQLAHAVAQTVSADVDTSPVSLIEGTNYGARATDSATSTLGVQAIHFAVQGTAELRWKIDTDALKEALVGKDQTAFQTIVTGFPGIQEAHARIEPFWKSSFPRDASKIKVIIEASKPQSA